MMGFYCLLNPCSVGNELQADKVALLMCNILVAFTRTKDLYKWPCPAMTYAALFTESVSSETNKSMLACKYACKYPFISTTAVWRLLVTTSCMLLSYLVSFPGLPRFYLLFATSSCVLLWTQTEGKNGGLHLTPLFSLWYQNGMKSDRWHIPSDNQRQIKETPQYDATSKARWVRNAEIQCRKSSLLRGIDVLKVQFNLEGGIFSNFSSTDR